MSHQLALLALRVSSRGFSLTNCILWGAAATAGALLGLIVFVVLAGAAPALSSVGLERFFADESWHPTSDQFNLAPLILGTFLVAAGALRFVHREIGPSDRRVRILFGRFHLRHADARPDADRMTSASVDKRCANTAPQVLCCAHCAGK